MFATLVVLVRNFLNQGFNLKITKEGEQYFFSQELALASQSDLNLCREQETGLVE